MISCLVVVICVLAFFQTTHNRAVAAITYAFVVGAYSLFAYNVSSHPYAYFSGAMLDFVIIALISIYSIPTRLAGSLIDICLISIVLNCFGFILWWCKIPPELYNILYGALYLIAILALLREESSDGYKLNWRYSNIRLIIRRCAFSCGVLSEKGT